MRQQWHQLHHMRIICISFIPHHLIFYQMDALPDAQPTVKALKTNWKDNKQMKKLQKFMEFCDKLPTSQKAVHFAVHTVAIKLQKRFDPIYGAEPKTKFINQKCHIYIQNNVCLWKLLNRPQILVRNIKALTARPNWCGKTNRILTHCSITLFVILDKKAWITYMYRTFCECNLLLLGTNMTFLVVALGSDVANVSQVVTPNEV